jgi:hypothetical protein
MKSVRPCSADRPALRDPRLFSMSAVNQRRAAGSGVIWSQRPIAYAVIPAEAGIQSLDNAFPGVYSVDSRFRGNDGVGEHPFDANGATTRGAGGELWQPSFFDGALRSVQEYNAEVESIHLNPVRAGLVSRPEDGRRSSYNECAGMSAQEQNKRCSLIACPALRDRPRENALRSARTNLIAPSPGRKDADHTSGPSPCVLE